jgi:hypothetical protein
MRYAFTQAGAYIAPTDSEVQSTEVAPPDSAPGLWPRWGGSAWHLSALSALERPGWLVDVSNRIADLWAQTDAYHRAGMDENDRAALLWATAPPVWSLLPEDMKADLQRFYAWGAGVWAEYWRGKAAIQADLPFAPDYPPPPSRARITEIQTAIAMISTQLGGGA